MTNEEEQELLNLTRDNNRMLREIITFINLNYNCNDDAKEFFINVIANLISNKR